MLRAYRGIIDDEGETEAEAVEVVRDTVAGAFGTFVAPWSRIIERDGRLVSASLVTFLDGRPFLAFSMTDPDVQRQGLARTCLRASMQALCRARKPELGLVVTQGNVRAVALYESLGFAFEP